jgi:hypothetical protein
MNRKMFALGFLWLIGVIAIPVSQAQQVPLFIEYTGTVRDTPFDTNGDGLFADFVDGRSRGTFGPSMTTILTEFAPPAEAVENSCGGIYLELMYSKAVTTFKNGDQLYAEAYSGSLCLNPVTGDFEGAATGIFIGGTGRFANASGDFVSPFEGRNLSLLEVGFGFGSIQGTIEATIDLR